MLAQQAVAPMELAPPVLIGGEAHEELALAAAEPVQMCLSEDWGSLVRHCEGLQDDRALNSISAILDEPSTPPPADSRYQVSGNVAVVSDYRVAGVTSTGHAAALQGEMDVDGPDGWSAGVWISTIERTARSNFEVDLYGATKFHAGDTELSLGAVGIVLPGGDNAAVAFVTASASRPIGPFDVTMNLRYAWPQGNIDDEDDLYVSASAKSPIGRLVGIPLTLGLSAGYEHGAFAIESVKYDWTVSLTANVHGVDMSISYVDTNLDDKSGSPGCILSIARSF